MAFKLGAVLALKDDNFTSKMKSATKQVGGFQKATKLAKFEANKLQQSVATGFKSSLKSVVGLAGGYLSLKAAVGITKDLITSANESIESETRLRNMMMNVKGTTESQVKSTMDYANTLQLLGVVGGDEIIRGQAQLATFNLQSKSIKVLSKGMADLAVNQYGVNVTGEQMQGVANVIGKAMDGSAGSLRKYGVTLTANQEKLIKNGNQMQRAATIAEVLQANVGGINEAMAKTPAGAVKQFSNAFGDMKEELGKALLPELTKFAIWGTKQIPTMQKSFQKGMAFIGGTINNLKPIIGNVTKWFSDKFGWIAGEGDNFKGKFNTVINGVKTVIKDAQPVITPALDLISTAAKLVYDGFNASFPLIKPIVENMWKGVKPILDLIGIGLKFVSDTLKDIDNLITGKPISTKFTRPQRDGNVQLSSLNRNATGIKKDNIMINNQNKTNKIDNLNISINGANKSTDEIVNEMIPKIQLALRNAK